MDLGVITLHGPMYRSVLQHCRNRSLREERILELRLEKAKLLGFSNYAEVSMEMKMASIDEAKALIEKLYNAARDTAVQELEDIREFARAHGERLRESEYDISEEMLRPYLSLPKVMEGLFDLTKKLFDVEIEQADGIAPVWNENASFYKVMDSSRTTIAYFYFDPYSRPPEKRGGAWKETVVSRSITVSTDGTRPRLPIAVIVSNQTPPTQEKPSLMTVKESSMRAKQVEAVFHEFGHALQHMLTTQDEGLVSGSQGIEWDAVEIPSLFMENWCYQRGTIRSLAKHYETGETLSDDAISKIISARTFRACSLLLRQLRYAGVDLELHTSYLPGGPKTIHDIDQEIGAKTQPIPLLPEDRFLCSFSHIFADSYAAGYYSYQWAEVLSADAFSAFEEAGLDNEKVVHLASQSVVSCKIYMLQY
ncbi:hypothetical protein M569_14295 [Genlisea aurea]|uniref:oligopeptidase A n=1 Tax=Genlisea aurea TaxID=192259 RepID=S8DCH6_9LAMI|nr:hypothetical protein M569_14295 [Genlisea aurea]